MNSASARLRLGVHTETNPLQTVILGIGQDPGKPLPIDPVSIMHIRQGTYPREEDIIRQLEAFSEMLEAEGIEVLRPQNLKGVNQVFSRDIGFVIQDCFVTGGMARKERRDEIEGIRFIIDHMDDAKVLELPDDTYLEGGDVLLYHDYVFVGLSKRTNEAGARFLQEHFPDKEVVALQLVVSDDPQVNNLHLDCVFQPVGKANAVLHPRGFHTRPEILYDLFPEDRRLEIDTRQKVALYSNFFSLSPGLVVIEQGFDLLRRQFHHWGIDTRSVAYDEVAKQGGLLRCTTLPLRRHRVVQSQYSSEQP